jgi:hypothetical protein
MGQPTMSPVINLGIYENGWARKQSLIKALAQSGFAFIVAIAFSVLLRDEKSLFHLLISIQHFTYNLLWGVSCASRSNRPCDIDGWDFLLVTSRLIFAFGLLSSMIAQTRIESYFKESHLSEFTSVNSKTDSAVEFIGGWTIVFLTVAFGSLATLQYPLIHIPLSGLYLCLIFAIDVIRYRRTEDNDHGRHFFLDSPARIAKVFSRELICKVDMVSIVPLTIMTVLAALIYFFGDSAFGPIAPPGGSPFASWGYLAEIFLSGAIGFHLFSTLILIESIMATWNEALAVSAGIYRHEYNKKFDRSSIRGYCPQQCFVMMVRPTLEAVIPTSK